MRPTPPLRLTVRDEEDLVALAPSLLGFWPEQDVVMLTFGARCPFHARVDLPPLAEQDAATTAALAASLAIPAGEHQVRAVALLFYTDAAADAREPWRQTRRMLQAAGVRVVNALVVGTRTFCSLVEPGAAPRRYDVATHPFVQQARRDGRLQFGSRAEMVASLEPDPDRIGAVAAALADGTQHRPGSDTLVSLRRMIYAAGAPGPVEVAGLLAAVAAESLWARLEADAVAADADERRFWAGVLPQTPPGWQPRVAAVLGYAAWRAGDGAMAWAAVDRVRRLVGDDAAAERLAAILEDAVPPQRHGGGRRTG